MSELLACPFCGGRADPHGWLDGHGKRGPECEDCGATSMSIEDWNRRTAPPGWQLVPIKPTPKMSSEYNMPPGLDSRDGTECWDMMLSAAPRFGDEP